MHEDGNKGAWSTVEQALPRALPWGLGEVDSRQVLSFYRYPKSLRTSFLPLNI